MKKQILKKKVIRADVFISKISHHGDFHMFWYEVSGSRKIFKGTLIECGDEKQRLIDKYKHCRLIIKS